MRISIRLSAHLFTEILRGNLRLEVEDPDIDINWERLVFLGVEHSVDSQVVQVFFEDPTLARTPEGEPSLRVLSRAVPYDP